MRSAPPKTYRGYGRVAYLAIRADIEDKLAKGWHLTAIYAEHEHRLPIGYKQFAKYVQRYSEASRYVWGQTS
ncbi:TraK family protein [Brevundimonas sp.]|uniref:TraK family protein n=1 Tax=Brevundimonas sp. TaxID=1871086 RepID=UPI0028A74C7C|nr:TraK family protein [Brevundimonas sp.]